MRAASTGSLAHWLGAGQRCKGQLAAGPLDFNCRSAGVPAQPVLWLAERQPRKEAAAAVHPCPERAAAYCCGCVAKAVVSQLCTCACNYMQLYAITAPSWLLLVYDHCT